MKNLIKAAAAAAAAGTLLFAAPAVAQAYVPTGPDTITITVTGSGPVPLDGFVPGADVNFTLVGSGVTAANLASAARPVTATSLTKAADSSGVATAVVTLPENPTGTYTLSASGARAANTGGTGSTDGGSTGSNAGSSSALPATGMDANSLLGLWVGGGALALAGGAIAVGTKVRRTRQENNA